MMHDALRGDVLSAILANTDAEKETVRTDLEKYANNFRALEQTAASLEERTGTVKHNADNAKQADHLALESRHTAEQSGTVVTEAVGSMERLTTSARRLTEMISVINLLAFQTNLLAFNASVEAARAGEHGRGFAVLADEVRKLAQRSAEAAKESESLRRDSGQHVEAGAALVKKAGQALQDIVGSVQHVSTIVAEIASTSQEQVNPVSNRSMLR